MDEIDQLLGKYGAPAPKAKRDDVDGILAKYAAPSGYHGQFRMVGQDKPADVPRLPPAEDLNRPAPEGPSQGTAAARGFVQGATMNQADELAGVGAQLPYSQDIGSLSEGAPMFGDAAAAAGQKAIDASKDGAKAYVQGRDEYRANDQAARDAHPLTFGAAELGGNLATSFVPLGVAAKGVGTASKVVRAVGRATASGAVQASGASDADLMKGEGAQFLEDTAKGAATSAVLTAGGEVAAGVVKKTASAVQEGLKRRILNEVAEGVGSTTATGRKRLDKAGKAIVEEVVEGPDASKVRKAYMGDAEKGRATLAPIVDRIGSKTEKAYAKIEAAGKGDVSPYGYLATIEEKAQEAIKAGRTRDAEALRAFGKRVHEAAKETGGLSLTQLRGLTTEAQGISSSVLGSLNEHANAKVARRVEGVVTEAMGNTLADAVKGDKSLTKAAKTIRENNRRMNVLLTIDDALKTRAYKETTGKSMLVRGAENVATSAAAGGAIGAVTSGGDVGDRVTAGLEGAVVGGVLRKGVPSAARAVDRLITSGGIAAARSGTPVMGDTAERLARALGRTGAGMFASHKATEQEEQGK